MAAAEGAGAATRPHLVRLLVRRVRDLDGAAVAGAGIGGHALTVLVFCDFHIFRRFSRDYYGAITLRAEVVDIGGSRSAPLGTGAFHVGGCFGVSTAIVCMPALRFNWLSIPRQSWYQARHDLHISAQLRTTASTRPVAGGRSCARKVLAVYQLHSPPLHQLEGFV